jgi:hypothetical protein
VGEVVGAPGVVGGVRRVVVEDGEAPGSSGVSNGGLLLRRRPCTGGGVDLAIGGLRRRIYEIEVAGGVLRKSGGDWRAQFGRRGPPFIAARGGCGARLGLPWSPSVQGREEPSDGRGVLATSMRC